MKKFDDNETINRASRVDVLMTASTTKRFVKVWRSEDRRILFVLEWRSAGQTALIHVLPIFRCGARVWVTPEVSNAIALSVPGKSYAYPGLAEKDALDMIISLERRDSMGHHTYSMMFPVNRDQRDRVNVADICELHHGVSQIGNGLRGADRQAAAISTKRPDKFGGHTLASDYNPNNDRGCVRIMGYREYVGTLLGE
jgi:hypothetical protein